MTRRRPYINQPRKQPPALQAWAPTHREPLPPIHNYTKANPALSQLAGAINTAST